MCVSVKVLGKRGRRIDWFMRPNWVSWTRGGVCIRIPEIASGLGAPCAKVPRHLARLQHDFHFIHQTCLLPRTQLQPKLAPKHMYLIFNNYPNWFQMKILSLLLLLTHVCPLPAFVRTEPWNLFGFASGSRSECYFNSDSNSNSDRAVFIALWTH